jgi:nucleotide-binding universal stress UspA family protein
MQAVKKILCPIDFSETSHIIIEKAVALAKIHDAEVVLLYVVHKLSRLVGHFYGFNTTEEDWFQLLEQQIQAKTSTLLMNLIENEIPSEVKSSFEVGYGKVSAEIVRVAEAIKADIILMAMETADALAKVPLANYVTQVISAAPCPVLTYHKIEETADYSKILLPIDLRLGLENISTHLIRFFAPQNPDIQLITVINPESSESQIKKSKKQLSLYINHFKEKGIENVSVKVILGKNIGGAINDYAVAASFRMIMMNAYRSEGFSLNIIGSTTHNVVTRSRVPVFSCKMK